MSSEAEHLPPRLDDGGWQPPTVFDEYRLVRQLGRGGMGEVWLAHDTLLDRPVAVKFIGDVWPGADVRQQFLIEARAAARLSHPNVVAVYRVGEIDGHPFIVSEFVRGTPLDAMPKPVPPKRVIELGIGLARGLAAAHRRGVLHLDIKPGNAIIAEEGEVKLLDFGLAKLLDQHSRVVLVDAGMRHTPVRPTPAPRRQLPSRPEDRAKVLYEKKSAPAHELVSPKGSNPGTTTKPSNSGTTRPSAPGVAKAPNLADTLSSPRRQPSGGAVGGGDETTFFSDQHASIQVMGGTPHYMAPELWLANPASYRTDVYALGAVLFELCTGTTPLAGRGLHELAMAIVSDDPPSLRSVVPAIDKRFSDIVAKCLDRDPAKRFASADELRQALEELVAEAPRAAAPEGNPYRGLMAFDAEHRTLFFGRSTEIGTLIERLRAEPLLVVAGDSGVGKSSLCRAGVLPLVTEGALREERSWSIAQLTPGKHPVAALAEALASATGADEGALAEAIEQTPAWLGRDMWILLGQDKGLVICVDQLEELVTIADPEEAAIAAEALFHLVARSPGIRTLCTVRSDFLARVATLPLFGDEISRAIYLLRPLSPEKIREAIVGPAAAKGVSFESEALVDKLVASTSRAEGLPLLQFALAELWEARSDPRAPITAAALDAIGGVAGALARHADRILARLSAPEKDASRRILVELVSLEGTRAYRSEADLCAVHPRAREALDALVRARLLVAREANVGATYEIAHEALLRGWGTLREWIDEQDEVRIVAQRLAVAAAEWERLGKTREALWGDMQLGEASLVEEHRIAERERAFLEESKRATVRRRRLRRALLVGLPVVALASYGTTVAIAQRRLDRQVGTRVAEAMRSSGEAHRAEGEASKLEREAFAAFDDYELKKGEEVWARAVGASAGIDATLSRASQALEAALILDGSRQDVHGMLGDVLYERALNAEKGHAADRLGDPLARMALHDFDGQRRKRWDAAASLSIETDPEGARIVAQQYLVEGQRRVLSELGSPLGRSPLAAVSVQRGSYLLTFTAEGRAVVRLPVLLRRGEQLSLSVRLPLVDEIPAGYIYVPAGRFLFGTGIDESKRKGFLTTVPVHEVRTDDYIIARHEVTYGDYLLFLRALPSEERAKRMPTRGSMADDAVGLSELPDGRYRLSFKVHDKTVTAVEGEPFVYPTRPRRSTQDWLRFPVSGVSAQDGEAYAKWLSETRRVPGARLCTEREWERAARGADEREYPHGDELRPEDANFDETYGRKVETMGPDEVGSYPASTSPFGVEDIAGNVFEWATSTLERGAFVVRGGGYFYEKLTALSTNRSTLDPSLRDARVGLRICAAAPPGRK